MAETIHVRDVGDAQHQRELARRIMRRQLGLSIRISIVFMVLLIGLPLVNAFLPALANTQVMGFTASWLLLALLFYPITWLLSWIFIRSSDRIEHEIAATMRAGANQPGEITHR